MKRSITLLLLLLFIEVAFSQEQVRTISGRLTSSDGSPLPGINIVIKGTTAGTSTDRDGNYTIDAPIGSTLIFTFIGLRTQEILVTADNLKQAKSRDTGKPKKQPPSRIPPSFLQEKVDGEPPGVGILTNQTPSYKNKGTINPSAITAIKKNGDGYSIKMETGRDHSIGFGLQFTSSFGLQQVNRLPQLQNTYAQGRPIAGNTQWLGPDQQEIFSWGPGLQSLEYNGVSYPFDKNGMLVEAGTGNGKQANRYDPLSFFRNGHTATNELMLTLPAPNGGHLILVAENTERSGVIPESDYHRMNFAGKLKDLEITGDVTANVSLSYNHSSGDLLSRGSNYSSIIGSVYRTPVTFDNLNGLSPGKAINDQAYYLQDGSIRSHAPGLADNPVGLVNQLPDREELSRFMASANLKYRSYSPIEISFNGNIDRQWTDNIFGIPPGYSAFIDGRMTGRSVDGLLANTLLTPSYTFEHYRGNLSVHLSWQTQFEQRDLNRNDGFNFTNAGSFGSVEQADSVYSLTRYFSRTKHEIALNATYQRDDWLNIRLTHRNYFSTTFNNDRYANLFPAASASADLAHLLDLRSINQLKVYGSFSKAVLEAPLLYTNWAYQSTGLSLEHYNAFYESSELSFHSRLRPEIERKFETGLRFGAFYRAHVEISYFNNLTEDFITPVWNGSAYELSNSASIKNYGGHISVGYNDGFAYGGWSTNLIWSKQKNTATEVYTPDKLVPLSGFQSIQTVIAAGHPVGSIYGSAYERDEQGRMMIDEDGFPVEGPYKIIGNPLPDWTLGWSSDVRYKKLRFSFLIDIRKGGQVWNGTSAVLDYLGRSQATGELRNTSNHIFNGVDTNGNANVIPVDFFNADDPVENNRWTRYGWDGVGEGYIEDGSWIRLNEVTLSYTLLEHHRATGIHDVTLSLMGRNLLLITPYSGVDPTSTLFGYGSGTGLDLFNAPATRSYSAQVTIKI